MPSLPPTRPGHPNPRRPLGRGRLGHVRPARCRGRCQRPARGFGEAPSGAAYQLGAVETTPRCRLLQTSCRARPAKSPSFLTLFTGFEPVFAPCAQGRGVRIPPGVPWCPRCLAAPSSSGLRSSPQGRGFESLPACHGDPAGAHRANVQVDSRAPAGLSSRTCANLPRTARRHLPERCQGASIRPRRGIRAPSAEC